MTTTDITSIERVQTNPATRTRHREHISLITDAARRAGSYVAGALHRPVAPTDDALAGLDRFRQPFPEQARDSFEVLAELDRLGSPATTVTTHGRYFGYVIGGLDPAANAAAILASAWDQTGAMPVMSPVAAALDEVAGRWIVEALGLPATAQASFCGGATVANLTAIITARDALYARLGWNSFRDGLAGAPRLRVIVGEEVHASALKALALAGLGSEAVEIVPTDAGGAMRADAFPTDTDDTTLVILQAGNVNTGHSDPFTAIIPQVRERGGWVHVDGAFGLWAAASPRHAHLVAGVEGADSWATDGHKWLNTPYDSGMVIVRDPTTLAAAMNVDAAYLTHDGPTPGMARGIQMSQRARGIEVWAMLATHGRAGLAELIDSSIVHAQDFATQLAGSGADIMADVVLNQVLVHFSDDATTDAVISAVQRAGVMWAGATTWHGKRAMRISVSDAATTADDVRVSVGSVLESWAQVRAAR